MEAPGVIDHRRQSRFSDPRDHARLLDSIPPEPAVVATVARNLNVHYRAHLHELPENTRPDVDVRWLSERLRIDQGRNGNTPLDHDRNLANRVQGCCRDFTLFCVAVLRHHGVLARSRVGFAPYLVDGWFVDHVIPEYWDDAQGRWRVFDSEVADCTDLPGGVDPLDVRLGSDFITAARAWREHRTAGRDLADFGVSPDLPALAGSAFVRNYVVHELAHRFGDELLLWDTWGTMTDESQRPLPDIDLIDVASMLLLASDGGDVTAEEEASARYRSDVRLHPSGLVERHSPFPGQQPVHESIDHPPADANRNAQGNP